MKKPSSARPICQACHRPFDPKSVGATLTMGPTCAKNAGLKMGEDANWQLSFLDGLGDPSQSPPPTRTKVRLTAPPTLPASLKERFILAKMAFDDLFREFCNNGTLLHGEAAVELENELMTDDFEQHSLNDVVLDWLEPEHDLRLLFDIENQTAYYRREINGVISMLEIDPDASIKAKENVHTITSFTRAIRLHREIESGVQLSLLDLIEESEI